MAGPGYRASLSRNGRTVAFAEWGQMHVLDLASGSRVISSERHPDADYIALSPDGKWAATGTFRGRDVWIWDAHSGKRISILPLGTGITVLFSPDGRWLVTGGPEEYRFWRVGTWRPGLRIPRAPGENLPGFAAFTSDSAVLAVADSQTHVLLVDAASGRRLATLEAPSGGLIEALRFSPDGRRLAVCTESDAIHVWDIALLRQRLSEMGLDWDHPSSAGRAPPQKHARLSAPVAPRR